MSGHTWVKTLVATTRRGRLVKESGRFTLREMCRPGSTYVYRIRESGLRALMVHGTPDVLTFDQAFYQHVYEPPAPVHTTL